MRKLYAVIILFCIFYFIGGWWAVRMRWVTRDDYFAYAGIVGSLASVAGLLALTRPSLTQSDIQAVEIETLKSMTETAEQLRGLQSARTKTALELDTLELKKKEMELLVKKAGLALFLREQYAHLERQVLDEVARNERLSTQLRQATESAAKLKALDEEVEMDPNVHQLREIIEAASRREPSLEQAVSNLPPVLRSLFIVIRALNQISMNLIRVIVK